MNGSFSATTGEVLLVYMDCTQLLAGELAITVAMGVQLDKAGGPGAGSVVLATDATTPTDCVGAPTTTGPVTLTPLAEDHNEDSAESLAVLGHADPCSDYEELGGDPASGGLRDPFNPYDFFDVDGDSAITLDDILIVADAFGPSTGPNYHPSKDRGLVLGPHSWNREGPDGDIVLDDVLGVSDQFGHTCSGGT